MGSIPRVASLLACSLARHGASVRVLSLEDGPLRADLERARVACDIVSGSAANAIVAVRRFIRRLTPDIVHTHSARLAFIAGLAAGMPRRPRLVMTLHSLAAVYESVCGRQARWRLMAERAIAGALVDACVAVSSAIRDEAVRSRGVPLGKTRVIHNAVDTARFAASDRMERKVSPWRPPSASHVIVSMGRLIPPKGHQVAIEALGHLQRLVTSPHLLLIGDGPFRPTLERLAAERGLRANVAFTGDLVLPVEPLAAGDVFVFPSLEGALGLSALEAMAAGLPVVASALPATSEFASSGENAVLVPPGDPSALAGAIADLLLDPQRARAIAAAGREMVIRRFGADRFAEEHLALYRELCGR